MRAGLPVCATTAKAMPVIGLFAPTDQPGDLPSLGAAPSAFLSAIIGMTTISAPTDQLTALDSFVDAVRPDPPSRRWFELAEGMWPSKGERKVDCASR